MSHKTKLRPLAVALTLAVALAVAAPAEAAGRVTSPGLMAEARAWILELLPTWLQLEAWTGNHGHTIDPNSGQATGAPGTAEAGAENKAGHEIDPNG